MSVPRWAQKMDEMRHWRQAFQVLAVKRCQPFLLDVGVPPGMACSPERLMRVARHFLQAEERVGGRDLEYERAADSLVENTFAKLAKDYGEHEARALHDWAERHFVSHARHMQLWAWSTLLHLLADVYGHGGPKVPSPLSPPTKEGFVKAVRARFNRDVQKRDEERLAKASMVPLSPLEHQLVALEVTEPSDPSEVDVLLSVREAMGNERAYQIWVELDRWLQPSEREALVRWAREEAAVIEMPLELVVPPT